MTVAEIVDQGVGSAEAGASVLHIQVRDEPTGRTVTDRSLCERVLNELNCRTDAVLQPITAAGRGMTVERRVLVVKLRRATATLNADKFNLVPYPVAALFDRMPAPRERGLQILVLRRKSGCGTLMESCRRRILGVEMPRLRPTSRPSEEKTEEER